MLNFSIFKPTAATLLTVPATILHKTVGAMTASSEVVSGTDCHGQVCHPVEQFCYHFEAACLNCSSVCDPNDIKYQPAECTRECGGKYD